MDTKTCRYMVQVEFSLPPLRESHNIGAKLDEPFFFFNSFPHVTNRLKGGAILGEKYWHLTPQKREWYVQQVCPCTQKRNI